ncbi:Nin one binding Zn-ribbon like-domain-containing protein [Kalaharituber pfeilii]|nr:Nin one binding Zn-ribbon like-domain-containing protein [Kalaharituber pfeilii]
MAAALNPASAIPTPVVQTSTDATPRKPIKALVLDTAPFLSHAVAPTSLLSRAERVYTTPTVLSEIRDPQARARLETQWLPFITARNPRVESIRRVSELAQKTGDREVLSATDLGVLGLAFELECELRSGDSWMRKDEGLEKKQFVTGGGKQEEEDRGESRSRRAEDSKAEEEKPVAAQPAGDAPDIQKLTIQDEEKEADISQFQPALLVTEEEDEPSDSTPSDDSDGGEWITPTNIDKFRKAQTVLPTPIESTETAIYAACATSDFAMQNILLLLPIPLISPTSPHMRIKSVKTWLLRCHACFYITRVMTHQFCPRCGGPTLLRTSCSTDSETGKTTIHLKKNFQWNNRGNIYPVHKPTGGRASGKEGNGVRHELILRADQKEYVRRKEEIERMKKKGERDLMDGDYLPGLLTGERGWSGGRVKVGYGRQNPNAKKGGKGRKK